MLQAANKTKSVLTALVLAALTAPAWADEYTVISAEGAPIDPTGVASVVITSENDDVTRSVDLPFAFPYFGRLYERVSICSNGWAALGDTTSTVSSNPTLPSTAAPNAVLAPLWDDLSTAGGSVRTYTNGSAPARVFVIDWSGVGSFDGQASGLRFQVAILEQAGVVEFRYGSGGTFSGMSYTAGIEDPTGTIAFSAVGTGNDLSARPTGLVRFEPRSALVSGRLLRDRPVADESGLGNSTETGLPLAGSTLRLIREDTGDLAATALTGPDGTYTILGFGMLDTTTLAVEVVSEGVAGQVVDGAGQPYSFRFATALAADAVVAVGDTTLDADTDAVNATIRRALNIQQAVERGYQAADGIAAWGADNLLEDPKDTIPALSVRWAPGVGQPGGTSYTPADAGAAASLSVSEATGNPDAYDDDVILHEYGQHVLASLSVHPGALQSPRDFAATTSPEFAWADGFGYFFAAGLQQRARLVDTISSDVAVVDDLESPPSGARGDNFPSAVAGSLWDIIDPANEVEDDLDGTAGVDPAAFVDVVAHVDRYLDKLDDTDGESVTVRSFFDVWHAGGSPEDTALRVPTARIFIHHGTLSDDVAEPDDRIDEAADTEGPGSKITGRRLSPENHDVFRLVVPGVSPVSTQVVLQQTTSTDVAIDLLDSAGALIETASNQGVGGSGRDTLSLEPAAPLPPGTYYVRVRSVDSRTVEYSVSFFNPFLLSTGDLPNWTAGIPFKQDLAAAGGVSPYTFSTSTNAPGLDVTDEGTRVTGVPLEAGAFDVTVVVTDSAMPPNVIDTLRPLLVNPPPTLPTLFGVAENRDASRLLGSGGTEAEWTPLLQPPGAMTLAGGAELRLLGNSGPPTSFALSADAHDAVGARLDGAATFVVVTHDMLDAEDVTVPDDDAFGLFLDALAGSEIDVTLRFRGTGQTPTVLDILDDAGGSLLTDGLVDAVGRKVKIRGVVARQTGRAHLLFDPEGFAGTLRVNAKARVPKRYIGEAGITSGGDVLDITIDALAGAHVKIDLSRQPSPTELEPTVLRILQPDGLPMALPTERRRGRKRAILSFVAPQDGRFSLRLGARADTTGPLLYKVRIKTPSSSRLVLD